MNGPLPVINLNDPAFNPCHGKSCYPTKKAAVTAMRVVMCRRKNRPHQIRSYWCYACECHHLTSKPDRND